MRGASVFGLALVVFGILYLLNELHVVGGVFTPGVLWPLLFVLIGLQGLTHLRAGRIPWYSIFFVALGALLVVHNTGLFAPLTYISSWALFWALVFITLGLALLSPKRAKWPIFHVHVGGKPHTVDVSDFVGSSKAWNGHHRPWDKSVRRWVGDVSIGRQPWNLKDMEIWNAIGDVRLNLSTAHIDDGAYRLRIGGWIGDLRILVPASLAVCVNANVGIGDLQVFDDGYSGTGRHVEFIDPGFDQAEKKVFIDLDLKIGDIQVVRV